MSRFPAPLLFLLVSLLPLSGAWAHCWTNSDVSLESGLCPELCYSDAVNFEPKCASVASVFVGTYSGSNGDYIVGVSEFSNCWTSYGMGCANCGSRFVGVGCTSQSEMDSVQCVSGGSQWNGTSCASADSIGYGCITFTKQTTWGGTYTAHRIYKLNYTQKTDELLEEAGGSCVDRGFCGKIGASSEYLSSNGQSCFENDSGAMGQQFNDDSGVSSSSSFDWDMSSSSVSCKNTGVFGNTCYYECDNGGTGTCTGNDGKCDVVSDCSWDMPERSSSSGQQWSYEDCQLAGCSWNATTEKCDCTGNKEGCENLGGTYSAVGGCQFPTRDYMAKLNEILDTLHNGNMATRGTNSQLAQISTQLENMNVNVALGGSGGLTKGAYDEGVSQIVEAENGTQVKLDALGNVIETKFASSDSLQALGWQKIDYWREFDSVQSVRQNENDSIQNSFLMRITNDLMDTSEHSLGDTSMQFADYDSLEVWRSDTANAYLPLFNKDSVVNEFLSTLDTSALGDSALLSQLDGELSFSVDSLKLALDNRNSDLKSDMESLTDSAYRVWNEAVYAPFDSILERVLPADNDHCPEECYKFDLTIPFGFGDVKANADFSKWLCSNSALAWSGGKGVLWLIRLLLRFLSAFSAVWIVFKFMGKSL